MIKSYVESFAHFAFPAMRVKSFINIPLLIAGVICMCWLVLLSFSLSSLFFSYPSI